MRAPATAPAAIPPGDLRAGLDLRPRGCLRRGIAASLVEGAAVGVVFNVLEQWLVPLLQVRLGASAQTVFLLTLGPLVVNAVAGPWAGRLIAAVGGYRRATIGVGIFQSACLVLLALPVLRPDLPGALPGAVLVATAMPASLAVSQPAWFAWTGTFVPAGLQGRYFGYRNRLHMLAKLSAAALFAIALDRWPLATDPCGLCAILATAATARLVAVAMLRHQPEPAPRPTPRQPVSPAPAGPPVPGDFPAFLRGLPASHFGRWNIVWAALFSGVMLAGPAFAPYMLAPVAQGGLGLADQPLRFTALVTAWQVMRLLANPLAGWVIDRVGPTLVLRWGLIGIAIVPLSWTLVTHVPTLIAIEVANGLCWCAAECAALVLILGCHGDPGGRIRLIGYHQALLGAVQAIAATIGMILLPMLPPLAGSSFRTLFLISMVLRLPAAILAWTLLPRLPVDARRALRGMWRQLPGIGLVAGMSRGVFLIMRRIVEPDTISIRLRVGPRNDA